jgi:hypothetical protein
MSRHKPSLWKALGGAFAIAIATAAFIVTLIGKPTWALRIGAVSFVVLVVAFAAVWYWGFYTGSNWPDSE